MTNIAAVALGKVGAALLLGGCAAAPVPVFGPPPPPPLGIPAPPPRILAAPAPRAGDPVSGRTARELETVFGAPVSLLVEGPARRLQFANGVCVLDAYLYPQERGEPAVVHVDTRRPTGEDIDRATCVAALRTR